MLDTATSRHLTLVELEAALPAALQSPKDDGTLELIVRRPAVGRRDVVDISAENVPHGTRLSIGSAVIEVTAQPHTGCGHVRPAVWRRCMKFVNSPKGRELRLRGINARVVVPGRIQTGDRVKKESRRRHRVTGE